VRNKSYRRWLGNLPGAWRPRETSSRISRRRRSRAPGVGYSSARQANTRRRRPTDQLRFYDRRLPGKYCCDAARHDASRRDSRHSVTRLLAWVRLQLTHTEVYPAYIRYIRHPWTKRTDETARGEVGELAARLASVCAEENYEQATFPTVRPLSLSSLLSLSSSSWLSSCDRRLFHRDPRLLTRVHQPREPPSSSETTLNRAAERSRSRSRGLFPNGSRKWTVLAPVRRIRGARRIRSAASSTRVNDAPVRPATHPTASVYKRRSLSGGWNSTWITWWA